MELKLAIIDGDSLCYLSSKDTLQESIESIDNRIASIFDETGSNCYYLFLSEGKYFRHNINKDYKGKKSTSPLKYLKTLKSYLKEQYLAEYWKGVEADDAVGYTQNAFKTGKLPQVTQATICAIDKDVKKQIEGQMYDYKKNEHSSTTAEEAEMFIHIQSIMGDSTDNITGIPGKGEKKAEALLAGTRPELHPLIAYKAYLEHYKNSSLALHEYQKNFKQVYILRTDEDFMEAVGYIPNLKPPITIIN